MLIRLFSDIHLDFDIAGIPKRSKLPKKEYLWQPEVLDTDGETVLVLAGDLWFENRPFERRGEAEAWIELIAARFKAVVIVLGNHDYWHGSLQRAPVKAKEAISSLGLTNVHMLEKDVVVLDGVKFVGATLWTSFHNGDPLVIFNAGKVMNDYKRITYGVENVRRKLRPGDVYVEHKAALEWLKKNAKRDTPEQELIVITHMAPTYESIHERFRIKSLEYENYLYYSSLDYTILDLAPKFWFHGHTHSRFVYDVDSTRVICNPRGYVGECTHYDEISIIDTSAAIGG